MAVTSVLLQPGWMSGTLFNDVIIALVLVKLVKSVVVPMFSFFNAQRKLSKTVPSPEPHWLFGHARLFPHSHEGFKKRVEMMKDFPLMFCYHFSCVWRSVHVHHPDIVRQILTSPLPKGSSYDIIMRPLHGDALITSSGKKWQRHRHLLTPVFHFAVLKSYVKTFNESIPLLTDWLEKVAESGESSDICKQLAILTPMPYAKALEDISQLTAKRFYNPLMWSDKIFALTKTGKAMLDARNTVHNAVRKIIRDRKQVFDKCEKQSEKVFVTTNDGAEFSFRGKKNKQIDFLDILFQTKDEEGQGLSESDIIDEVQSMFSAGQGTISKTMSWFSYLLAKNQDWQEKCRAEVTEVCGSDGEILSDDILKLKILSRCLKETLRLYPVGSFVGRVLTSDMTFKNPYHPPQTITLDKGTSVAIHFYALHHHPDFWESPEVFDPDRFTPERSKGRSPFAYLPFSGGSRNCLGQNFAFNQIKVTFGHILRRFRLRLPPGKENIKMEPGITLAPHNGVFVKVEKI